ncbi:hypothetical protein EXIGLDRAFT_843344 [Exidia glandulosa HHB12029]|uniref:Arrestin-like N-terminal domain-containing protein n=1 Tax=Exidia glandulosa HHB12029 TaxID=1314781 RepID=A0A165CQH8_EXIGL|nr:hypothetical protein EXIGLDRAFT_843344 [Exidia glandulosa HHB12029]
MSTLCPPSYSPSSASPSYSAVLRPEEVCLTRTARAHHHRATRVLVLDHESKSCPFSAAFLHQHDECEVPTYGRGDAVDGYIALHNTTGVVSVAVKLIGQTQLSTGSGGKHTFPFLQYNFELWHQETAESAAPDHLDFVLPLPTHIDDNGVERLLPSSSRTMFSGPYAIVEYAFKITVSTRGLGGVFKKSHSLSTPITYVHRSHPPQASLGRDESFLSTLKVAPEEWMLLETTVPQASSTSISPLSCTVALPASRIFTMPQPIPFHIQLTGSPDVLRQFLPSSGAAHVVRSSSTLDHDDRIHRSGLSSLRPRSLSPPTRSPSSSSHRIQHSHTLSAPSTPYTHLHTLPAFQPTASQTSSPFSSPLASPGLLSPDSLHSASSSRSSSPLPLPEDDVDAMLQVGLHRRVTLSVFGDRAWMVKKLAPEATLELTQCEPDAGWLAWSGTIVPSSDSWSPASRIGGLNINDYISLEVLRAKRGRMSRGVQPHSYAIPVKLVTDPFPDSTVVTSLDEHELSGLGLVF